MYISVVWKGDVPAKLLAFLPALTQSPSAQNPSYSDKTNQLHVNQQCVNEDVTAMNYSSDPLLDARDAVPIYSVPPQNISKEFGK